VLGGIFPTTQRLLRLILDPYSRDPGDSTGWLLKTLALNKSVARSSLGSR